MASQYSFRFETLLHLRQQRENERQRAVAARLHEIRALEEVHATLLDRIRAQTEQSRDALRSGSPDVDELKFARHWMIRLRRGVMETALAIDKQKALLESERRQLAEAAKEKKVLARLKERRLAEYLAELDRREQLDLDESNSQRAARALAIMEVDES